MTIKKSVGFPKNQSGVKFTYLLSDPFPEEEIILGPTKKLVLEFLYKEGNPHSISRGIGKARSTTIQHLQELQKKDLAHKGSKYGDSWTITEKGKYLIEKSVGFPVKSIRVALPQSVKNLPPDTNRGHALQFKIKLPEKVRLWTNEDREKHLKDLGIVAKKLNLFGGGQGIEYQGKKIHLTRSSLIIYDRESYFASKDLPSPAQKSEDNAMIKILYLLKDLERDLGVSFSINGNYSIKITKRHHALIKNVLAEIYNKPKRKKLDVYDETGLWLLIDNSYNLGELECVHSVSAVLDNDGMRKILNSLKRTDFRVTSEFTLGSLEQLKQNDQELSQRLRDLSNKSIQISQVMEQLQGNVVEVIKEVREKK